MASAGQSAGNAWTRNQTMQVLNNKLAAAVFSAAFSLVMFAAAIAPANHGALLPGTFA